MVRTQIFLTEKETRLIGLLARQQGVSRSAIIRQAVDAKLRIAHHSRFLQALRNAKGCLRGRPLRQSVRRVRARW